jgi:hypothetical protein
LLMVTNSNTYTIFYLFVYIPIRGLEIYG